MRAFRRAVAVAALAPLLALGVPAVASAATPAPSYGCEGGTDEYGEPLPCELELTLVSPICENDVPKLQYAVDPVGTPNTTVTISFLRNGVPEVVYPDLPLSGTVLWPGAVVDESGTGVDWPGWSLVDGEWVEGDEYDWVRPTVTVQFEVNPTATVDVAYPPSTPVCLTSPAGKSDVLAAGSTTSSDVLAATGSQVLPMVAAGAALLAAGGAALLFARRRRQDA